MLKSAARHVLDRFARWLAPHLDAAQQETRLLAGQIAARQITPAARTLREAEFHVFSQYGEDGIIQFLIARTAPPATFIEFGVQSYRESNTRFLCMHNGWKGLVIDKEQRHVEDIRSSEFGWKFELHAMAAEVRADNVDDLFVQSGFAGEIGLLSIDIDGNDYHVWQAISAVRPVIVVIEYNRVFPLHRPISVPYEPGFDRTAKHPSNLYYGASLSALVHLGKAKGYRFLGIERHRANAFFVSESNSCDLPTDEPRDEYQAPGAAELIRHHLAGMPVLNVVTGKTETL